MAPQSWVFVLLVGVPWAPLDQVFWGRWHRPPGPTECPWQICAHGTPSLPPTQTCSSLVGVKRNILLSWNTICSQIMYKTFAETTYSSCIFYESDPKLKYINIKISRSTLGKKKKSYFIKYQETNLEPCQSCCPPVQPFLSAPSSFSDEQGPFPELIQPLWQAQPFTLEK